MEKILVTRSSMPPKEEFISEISELWESHWLTNMGIKHDTFLEMLKQYLDVSNFSLFVNGHMALELTLQAMKLKGQIITTPYTFISTTHAIVRNDLEPVFCDINPNDYTIDTTKIEQLITDKTTAILPVHVYGNICNVEEINNIAKKYNLKVIYDAAHAFGVQYKGAGVAEIGDASMFSFHATKVFNSIEGGGISYKDEALGRELYRLKNFGIRDEENIDSIGANAKMNEFQAAMGICNLKHIDAEIKKRRNIFTKYHQRLKGISGLQIPTEHPDVKSNYAYYPVIFNEKILGVGRDLIFSKLEENGIYSRKYFYPLTNEVSCIKDKYPVSDTPIAKEISKSVLTLPIYADLRLEDVDRICDVILNNIK